MMKLCALKDRERRIINSTHLTSSPFSLNLYLAHLKYNTNQNRPIHKQMR